MLFKIANALCYDNFLLIWFILCIYSSSDRTIAEVGSAGEGFNSTDDLFLVGLNIGRLS